MPLMLLTPDIGLVVLATGASSRLAAEVVARFLTGGSGREHLVHRHLRQLQGPSVNDNPALLARVLPAKRLLAASGLAAREKLAVRHCAFFAGGAAHAR